MATESYVEQFNRDGYAIIPNFLSDEEIASMKDACKEIMRNMDPKEHSTHIFHPAFLDGKTYQSRDEYFMTSGDKIRFFFEPEAVDDKGNLKVPKEISVNKIGHALAWLDPTFKAVTFSDKVKKVCKDLGHQDPRLVQSMYIFKNPGIGQKVTTHQDSTFLYTDPPSHLLGFWIALDDATEENGCLFFVPGSQNTPPTCRFVRDRSTMKENLTITCGAAPNIPFDKFRAAPVSKGSLVLIHGNVIHRSEQNASDRLRDAYTFHVVDFHNAAYSPENWLQPSEGLPFPKINDVSV